MELRHLRYFVAVAEELSFTRAAERELIAQPSLSRQIRDLEEELGVRLFVRSTRTTELSAVGRELLPEARALLRKAGQFKESALRRKRGELGELRLSSISAFAHSSLAELLREFKQEHPGLKVTLEVTPSRVQADMLRQGAVDVGFVSLSADELVGLEHCETHSGPLSLAVPKGHRLAEEEAVIWGDLAGEPLILVEPGAVVPEYYSGFFRRCREAGVEPSVPQLAPNGATQLFMVSAGLGLAPIYIPGSPPPWEGIRVLALPEDAPVLRVSLAWRRLFPALERFLEFLDGKVERNIDVKNMLTGREGISPS